MTLLAPGNSGVCDEGVTTVTTHGDGSRRGPNSAVPTRTQVEPCFTAISKSLDMPADKPSAFGCASSTRRCSDCSRSKATSGPQSSGGMPINPTSSRPCDSSTWAQTSSRARGRRDVDAAARDVAVQAHLNVDAERVLPSTFGQGRRNRPFQCCYQLRAVDRMGGVRPAGHRTGLLTLNVSHHVPVQLSRIRPSGSLCQPSDFGHLCRRFLFARFTYRPTTQSRQNRDIGCRKEFGNREKFNFTDIAARRFRGHR